MSAVKRLIVLILSALMLLCCGCNAQGGTQTLTEPTPEPTPTPNVPVAVETVVNKPEKDIGTVDVTVTIHGEEEVIPMTPVSGSFRNDGGPDFSLLVDRSRYQVNDVGGFCYITLPTGLSGDVYAELGFRPDTKSKDIGTEILDEYGIMGIREEPVKEKLGTHTVRHIHGETVQNLFDVYVIDTEGGCMTVVLSTTAQTKAHRARLMTTMESLEIFE